MPGPYKIGEAAALLNLKTYVLRFWETEFSQIVPSRTETGRRVYTEEDLALLERIRFLLYEHGLTIEGARRVLSEEAAKGVSYTLPSTPERPATEPGGGEAVVTPTSPAKPASRNAPVDVPLGGGDAGVAPTPPVKSVSHNTPVDVPLVMGLQIFRFIIVLLAGPPLARLIAGQNRKTKKRRFDRATKKAIQQVKNDEAELD